MQKGFKAGLQCDMNITPLKIFLTYFMFGVSSNKIIKYTEKRAFQFILGKPLKKKIPP